MNAAGTAINDLTSSSPSGFFKDNSCPLNVNVVVMAFRYVQFAKCSSQMLNDFDSFHAAPYNFLLGNAADHYLGT